MSEPTVRRRRTVGGSNGAEERTRTSTGLLPLAPQASEFCVFRGIPRVLMDYKGTTNRVASR